jgi:hypothetical protein
MAETLGAPFGNKLYPGRLNPRELENYRATEMYEAIMTDMRLMGVITEAQFQQYTHRIPLPMINAPGGFVPPASVPANFIRVFDGHDGIGCSVDPAGNAPGVQGTEDGQYWYMLVWNNQWEMLEWKWFAAQSAWFFSSSELVPTTDYNYVMVNCAPMYVQLLGFTQSDTPEWKALQP